MSKLVVIVAIEIVPGRRDELLAALTAHKARCLRDEPGTLQFEILAPREDEGRMLTFEVYEDDSMFEVHRNSPSIAQFREEAARIVAALHITKCTFAA